MGESPLQFLRDQSTEGKVIENGTHTELLAGWTWHLVQLYIVDESKAFLQNIKSECNIIYNYIVEDNLIN